MEFAKFALEVLKNLPSTALVESRFSLTSMMKSKHRALLDIKKIRGMLLMKDEMAFNSPKMCFQELWSRMKPWLQAQGLIKPVGKRRSAYSGTRLRQGVQADLHVKSSAQYYD